MKLKDQLSLEGKVAVVSGSEGMFGKIHREVIEELGGECIGIDIKQGADIVCDITNQAELMTALADVGKVDILINNAIGNQKAVKDAGDNFWPDLAVGLGGAFYLIALLGSKMENGVILNMGSDLSLVAPDQSLYLPGYAKPVSYSVVKHGIIGLTRYFAGFWPGKVRCNCLCPSGLEQYQKVPRNMMGRLAKPDEMKGAIAFLISDASSFVNGAILTVDGGRTAI